MSDFDHPDQDGTYPNRALPYGPPDYTEMTGRVVSDDQYMLEAERALCAHILHNHVKRDLIFNKALELHTIHHDTVRVARLLDSHEVIDSVADGLAHAVVTLRAFFKAVGAENKLGLRALERYEEVRGGAVDQISYRNLGEGEESDEVS